MGQANPTYSLYMTVGLILAFVVVVAIIGIVLLVLYWRRRQRLDAVPVDRLHTVMFLMIGSGFLMCFVSWTVSATFRALR